MKEPLKKNQQTATSLFLEDITLSDEEFEKRNLLAIISSAIFLIVGPLFVYFGFYLVTSPFTVKWGALSIAVGLFILMFGFSLWQDRQFQIQTRLLKKDNDDLRKLIEATLRKNS